MFYDKFITKKIKELIDNTWDPKKNHEYVNTLKNMIINTLGTHWKSRKNELSENLIKKLEMVNEYNEIDEILEYIRNWDKEDIMKKYGWKEHEAKYNKKLIFDRLENKKQELYFLITNLN